MKWKFWQNWSGILASATHTAVMQSEDAVQNRDNTTSSIQQDTGTDITVSVKPKKTKFEDPLEKIEKERQQHLAAAGQIAWDQRKANPQKFGYTHF